MAIEETQLDTWAKIGPSQQFVDTYGSIKAVLESTNAPYHGERKLQSFLQGSYGNDTNVYGTGDVDIVACTSDTFGYDLSDLPQSQQDLYRASAGPNVQSACGPLKQEIFAWLSAYYGPGEVHQSNKAIVVRASGSRRKTDILACTDYRHYYRYAFAGDPSFHPGIRFCSADGQWIVNHPKQHAENCTTKHQATNGWFKPTVRILKNMRNRMINESIIPEELVSSYYIEGMLWNVPNSNFGGSYQSTIAKCLNFIGGANELDLKCANNLRPLVREGRPDALSTSDFNAFVFKAIDFWNGAG